MTVKVWHCEPPSYRQGQYPMTYPSKGDRFIVPETWPVFSTKEEAVNYTNNFVSNSLDFPEGSHHTYVVCIELPDYNIIAALNFTAVILIGDVIDVEMIDFIVST